MKQYICYLVLFINFEKCYSQKTDTLNIFSTEFLTLKSILEDSIYMNENLALLDSIFISSIFKIKCEEINKIDLKYYYNLYYKFSNFHDSIQPIYKDVVMHGSPKGRPYDPSLFELVKYSCKYYGMRSELIFRQSYQLSAGIINQNERNMCYFAIKNMNIDSIINIYNEIRSDLKNDYRFFRKFNQYDYSKKYFYLFAINYMNQYSSDIKRIESMLRYFRYNNEINTCDSTLLIKNSLIRIYQKNNIDLKEKEDYLNFFTEPFDFLKFTELQTKEKEKSIKNK